MRYCRGNDVRNSVRLHCIYAKTSHVLLHKLSKASSSPDNNTYTKVCRSLSFCPFISHSGSSLAEPWRIGNPNKKVKNVLHIKSRIFLDCQFWWFSKTSLMVTIRNSKLIFKMETSIKYMASTFWRHFWLIDKANLVIIKAIHLTTYLFPSCL